jgi:hypothetical protein
MESFDTTRQVIPYFFKCIKLLQRRNNRTHQWTDMISLSELTSCSLWNGRAQYAVYLDHTQRAKLKFGHLV